MGTLFIESILLAQGLLRARALLAFALRTIAALRVPYAPLRKWTLWNPPAEKAQSRNVSPIWSDSRP